MAASSRLGPRSSPCASTPPGCPSRRRVARRCAGAVRHGDLPVAARGDTGQRRRAQVSVILAVHAAPACTARQLALTYLGGGPGAGNDFGTIPDQGHFRQRMHAGGTAADHRSEHPREAGYEFCSPRDRRGRRAQPARGRDYQASEPGGCPGRCASGRTHRPSGTDRRVSRRLAQREPRTLRAFVGYPGHVAREDPGRDSQRRQQGPGRS